VVRRVSYYGLSRAGYIRRADCVGRFVYQVVIPRVRDRFTIGSSSILMLPFLQTLVATDLIKVLDDGNPTVLPAWDPMVCLPCSSI
jgi:hypothetical protein